jgi:translation initiation factor IF-2
MKRMGFDNTNSDLVLTAEDASMIVLEFGHKPVVVEIDQTDLKPRPEEIDISKLTFRPPVVTIMGHVDHGKTTLLDTLRKSSVAAGEAGGITQHIGAFSVMLPSGKNIVFLDTPGHAAFSAMRARGAQMTDIVVLVVAADDGVMPQTIEAINLANAANVPIIVAINKCDKPDNNIKRIKTELLSQNVIIEEMGGDIPCVLVSGKTGQGLQDLEDTIITLAEVMELKGDSSGPSEGVILESNLSKEKGYSCTLLVTRGTLSQGAVIVSGTSMCKVRLMTNENGQSQEKALPSMPVQVLGWKSLPQAGDIFLQAETEQIAKKVISNRQRRNQMDKNLTAISDINLKLEEKQEPSKKQDSGVPTLNLIVKADVNGTLEAIEGIVGGLPNHMACAHIVSGKVGQVSEADIDLAIACNAKIISFNLVLDRKIQNYAKQNNIEILEYKVIYAIVDGIKEKMSDLLPLEEVIQVKGEAEIMQIYHVTVKKKSVTVAGCKITNGTILRSNQIKLTRGGETIHVGSLKTFKHHKKDITEGSKGLECGMAIDSFADIQVGDVIQAITITHKKRSIG